MFLRHSPALLLIMLGATTTWATPQAHIVFFTLKESTAENRDALVAACHKYLAGHEGEVYFSVGVLSEDLDRPVNDRGFHVAAHMIFKDRAAHDVYQTHPRHLEFIEEFLPKLETVRVFDSDLVPAAKVVAVED